MRKITVILIICCFLSCRKDIYPSSIANQTKDISSWQPAFVIDPNIYSCGCGGGSGVVITIYDTSNVFTLDTLK